MQRRPFFARPIAPAVFLLLIALLPLARGWSGDVGTAPPSVLLVTLAAQDEEGDRRKLDDAIQQELGAIPLLPLALPSPLERAHLTAASHRGEEALRAAVRAVCKGRAADRMLLTRLRHPVDLRRHARARLVVAELRHGRTGASLHQHRHPRLFGDLDRQEIYALSARSICEAMQPFLEPAPPLAKTPRVTRPTRLTRATSLAGTVPVAQAVPVAQTVPVAQAAPVAQTVPVAKVPASPSPRPSPSLEGEKIRVLARLPFDPSSAEPSAEARRLLLEETFAMARHGQALILLEGEARAETAEASLKLATARSEAIGKFLIQVGKIPEKRIVAYGLPPSHRRPEPADQVTVSLVLPPPMGQPQAATAPDWIDLPRKGLASPPPARTQVSEAPVETTAPASKEASASSLRQLLQHYRRRHAARSKESGGEARPPETMPPPTHLGPPRAPVAEGLPDEPIHLRKVRPGDAFRIEVVGYPDMDRRILVRPDGMISFPLVGHVEGEGLSVEELQETLRKALSQFIVKVQVFLRPVYMVKVIGEVQKAGVYDFEVPPSLLDLIAAAGGAREPEIPYYAAMNTGYMPAPRLMAKIMRKGSPERIFDLSSTLRDSTRAHGLTFGHGDTLFIYRDKENLVFVTGAIENRVIYQRDMRLLQALIIAAGVSDRDKLNVKKVIVWRPDRRAGKVFKYEINVDDILFKGQVHRNLLLQPGDMIVVPQRKKRRGLPLIARDFASPLGTIANLFLLGKQF